MKLAHLVFSFIRPLYNRISRFLLKKHYRVEKPLTPVKKGGRILVLAPHVDDETIGLGGTIKRHAQMGADVTCVYVTDGSSSKGNLSPQQLVAARKKEAKQVQPILGIDSLSFMDLPDQHAASDESSQRKLKEIIEEFRPDLIYCPTLVDCHVDHIATGRILSDTLKQIACEGMTVRMYEINCPIPAEEINCVIDVTDTFKSKLAAIRVFKSQTLKFDGFLELNRLKAEMVRNDHPAVHQVEAFIECDAHTFVKRFDALDGEDVPPYAQLFVQSSRKSRLLAAVYKNLTLKKSFYKKSRQPL